MLKVQIIPLLIKTDNQSEAARLIAELSENNIPININNISSSEINRILAIEYFNKNNFSASLQYAKKIIYENYYDNEMHMLMGEIFRQQGQNERAVNHFNLVLKRNSRNIEARYGKIMVYWIDECFEDLYSEIIKIKKHYPEDELLSIIKLLHCVNLIILLMKLYLYLRMFKQQ